MGIMRSRSIHSDVSDGPVWFCLVEPCGALPRKCFFLFFYFQSGSASHLGLKGQNGQKKLEFLLP
jgi:hypothetical protein